MDTEFVRTRTFYARLGLIQVADPDGVWLVDTVAIEDLAAFSPLLEEPGLERVLHSCGEDLGIFLQRFGRLPCKVFDTQVAAALVGLGFSLGYQALVEEVLGIRLEKEETRSDWTARPLSASQLRYAARDVVYLPALHDHLLARLRELEREGWAREEFDALLDRSRYEVEPRDAWRRVKGARSLDRRGLGVLQALCAWREREAQRRDRARPFVVRDTALLAIARRRPSTPRQLREIRELPPNERRRHGHRLLELVREALSRPVARLPEQAPRAPRVEGSADLVRGLQELVARRARELRVAPELLAQKRVLEKLVRQVTGRREDRLPPELGGWRREAIGEPALRFLKQRL